MDTHGRCDVLIVEDDQLQCAEMAGFLARAQLIVETAQDGTTGLQQARLVRPRVALLDYNLPDMTGVQVAEGIRAMLPTAAILMMSGRIDGLSEKTLHEIGITLFVNKPVPLGPLRQAVIRLVQAPPSDRRPASQGWLSAGLGGTRS